MSYSEIKSKLFRGVVKEHLKLKRPIGSKILSKKRFSALSPATLRLYLSRLVEEKFLKSIHLYSGKVPTDKGWYYYFETERSKPVDLPFSPNLEKTLSILPQKYTIIACLFDTSFKIKGISNFIKKYSTEIEAVEEAINLLEEPEKLIQKVSFGVDLLIGDDLKEHISLFTFKNKNLFLGFLTHKRIDYPIIWSVFKEFLKKNFNVRAEKPKKSIRYTSRRTSITIN